MRKPTWERTDNRAILFVGKIPVADIVLDNGKFKARVGVDWTRSDFYASRDSMDEAIAWVEEKIGA